MLAIIDYDAGNLRSVAKALEKLGETPVITRNPAEIYPQTISFSRVSAPLVTR